MTATYGTRGDYVDTVGPDGAVIRTWIGPRLDAVRVDDPFVARPLESVRYSDPRKFTDANGRRFVDGFCVTPNTWVTKDGRALRIIGNAEAATVPVMDNAHLRNTILFLQRRYAGAAMPPELASQVERMKREHTRRVYVERVYGKAWAPRVSAAPRQPAKTANFANGDRGVRVVPGPICADKIAVSDSVSVTCRLVDGMPNCSVCFPPTSDPSPAEERLNERAQRADRRRR